MKKILSILLLFVMLHTSLEGGSVTLAWNPACDSSVVGYNLYYGQQSVLTTNVMPSYTDQCGVTFSSVTNVYHASFASKLTVGNVTNATLINLTEGQTYYFTAVSYDNTGVESPYSNESQYTVPELPHPYTNVPPTIRILNVNP